jgi:hypothetical protein
MFITDPRTLFFPIFLHFLFDCSIAILSIAKDFHQILRTRINCSGSEMMAKKTLTFDAMDMRKADSQAYFYLAYIESNKNVPQLGFYGLPLHMHHALTPIIHVADESLKDVPSTL